MKLFPVLIALFATSLSLHAQVIPYQELPSPASKPGADLYLEFSSPRDEVIIQDGKLTHISKTYQYDENRPWVATPVGTSQQAVAEAIPLNGHQLQALQEMINSTGIMQLPQSSYGAPDGYRSYDYEFRIHRAGNGKVVTYRSNPSYPGAPLAFQQMKEYVWKLVTEVEYR